ncbi:MAG: cell division protein FtsA [Bacteroidota bacterium]|jgi:cell division protein FtsA
MEKNKNIVVGLDIGTTKIAVLVGKKNEHGKLEILGMGKSESMGVRKGMVMNIDQTVQSIKEAVEMASNISGVDIKKVHVGIAGQHIRSMQHRGLKTRQSTEEEISQKDVDELIEDMYKLVMQPGEEIIHVLPQEFIVDNEQGIKDAVGMAGVRLEANFHIITGQVAAINNLIRCVQKAGLEVQDIFLEPIASSAAVLSEDEKEAGVALIDIGGGTTDVAIFYEGIIRHTAVIPFGGNVITEDIKMGCSIIKSQAELLKTKFGSAVASENQENEIVSIPGLRGREPKEISLKNLASIIEARMEEILHHVMYEIKNSGFQKKLGAGIVITGGGSQLKHILQLTQFVTGMVVKLGYPTEHLAQSAEEIKKPMYSTGIGLVLLGFDELRKKALSNPDLQIKEEIKEVSADTVSEEAPNNNQAEEPERKESAGFWERFKKWFSDDIKE